MSFPKISINFFNDLDNYLIDTIPFRDKLIDLALLIKNKKGISKSITILDVSNKTNMNKEMGINDELFIIDNSDYEDSHPIDTAKNINIDVSTKSDVTENKSDLDSKKDIKTNKFNEVSLPNSSVIIMEKDDGIQCTTIFTGANYSIYINAINNIKKLLGNDINLYSMIIPSSSAFYLPEELKDRGQNQAELIKKTFNALKNVKTVFIYDNLYKHKNERLYLYSDTHWAQRGAFYASEKFAEVAGVDFKPLTDEYYEEKTIDNFVGSYYRYTEDARLLTNPETFYYYVPKNNCDVTIYNHTYRNDEYSYTKESMFKSYFDESKSSYSIFMGGDSNMTIIKADNNSNRKLLILKDSNGNCIAPNLFYSFDEIYVCDYRYTPYNLTRLIRKNGITDVLIETTISMMGIEGEKYEEIFTKGFDFNIK